jgi:hypothetical protein
MMKWKKKNNKRDIDEVESNDSKEEEHDKNAGLTTPNKKIKILEPLTDERINCCLISLLECCDMFYSFVI